MVKKAEHASTIPHSKWGIREYKVCIAPLRRKDDAKLPAKKQALVELYDTLLKKNIPCCHLKLMLR